jgi:hypothetical protein
MNLPAGHAPAAYSTTTAPAGSRENQIGIHPAVERRRTSALMARTAELGYRMRRNDARALVLAWSEHNPDSDGWDDGLRHRFDPTRDAVFRNLMKAER